MDFVLEAGTLLVGTNTPVILSQQIFDLLSYEQEFDPILEDDGLSEDFDEREMGGEEYDPLEGRSVDENLERILKEQKDILQQDREGAYL